MPLARHTVAASFAALAWAPGTSRVRVPGQTIPLDAKKELSQAIDIQTRTAAASYMVHRHGLGMQKAGDDESSVT